MNTPKCVTTDHEGLVNNLVQNLQNTDVNALVALANGVIDDAFIVATSAGIEIRSKQKVKAYLEFVGFAFVETEDGDYYHALEGENSDIDFECIDDALRDAWFQHSLSA